MTNRPHLLRRLASGSVLLVLTALGVAPSPAVAQVDPSTVAALELRGPTTGIVMGIVHEGELSLLDTYGTPTAESPDVLDPEAIFPFPWGTQMLVGITARALDAAGTLSLDAAISDYLPELAPSPLGAATLAQLLEHRAGLPELIPPPGIEWGQVLDLIGGVKMVATPGTVYSHSRVSYPLAIRVMERVVGLPFNEVASAAVLTPLGMEHSSFSPVTAAETGQLMQGYREEVDTVRPVRHLFDSSGLPILYTSAPDLLGLAVTWMSGGLNGADPLLPLLDDDAVLGDRRFADGLWMESGRTPARSWSSDQGLGFGANLTLYPATRTAVLVVANGRLPTGMLSWALGEVEVTLLGVEAEVAEVEVPPLDASGGGPPPAVADTAAGAAEAGGAEEAPGLPPLPPDLADWVGTFANGGLTLVVALGDDGLPLLVEGETRVPLFRIGENRWAFPGRDRAIPMRFLRVAGAPAIESAGLVYTREAG